MDARITYEYEGKRVCVLLSEVVKEIGFDYGLPNSVLGLAEGKIVKIEVLEGR